MAGLAGCCHHSCLSRYQDSTHDYAKTVQDRMITVLQACLAASGLCAKAICVSRQCANEKCRIISLQMYTAFERAFLFQRTYLLMAGSAMSEPTCPHGTGSMVPVQVHILSGCVAVAIKAHAVQLALQAGLGLAGVFRAARQHQAHGLHDSRLAQQTCSADMIDTV